MSYHFSKTLKMPFDKAIQQVTDALASKGFGVLTTIDVRATLKKKVDVDFHPYTIIGACNPGFAHKALQREDKIGTMLPATWSYRKSAQARSRSQPSIPWPQWRRSIIRNWNPSQAKSGNS